MTELASAAAANASAHSCFTQSGHEAGQEKAPAPGRVPDVAQGQEGGSGSKQQHADAAVDLRLNGSADGEWAGQCPHRHAEWRQGVSGGWVFAGDACGLDGQRYEAEAS